MMIIPRSLPYQYSCIGGNTLVDTKFCNSIRLLIDFRLHYILCKMGKHDNGYLYELIALNVCKCLSFDCLLVLHLLNEQHVYKPRSASVG